ncbi:MAG: DUF853 family protein, partial [Neisseriaceae bacterium]|nr:DUF853 family protein [Neisseriaceae bacterium]
LAEKNKKPGIFDAIVKGATGQRKQSGGGLAYDVANSIAQSVRRKAVSSITRTITRGILGAITGKK